MSVQFNIIAANKKKGDSLVSSLENLELLVYNLSLAKVHKKDQKIIDELNKKIETATILVKERIKAGDDVNAKGKDSKSPLHFAAQIGSVEIINLLIERKADINAKDAYGTTPLITAMKSLNFRDRLNIVMTFINAGADVKLADGVGRTPLHWWSLGFVGFNESESSLLFAELMKRGADINAADIHGETPLYMAAGDGRTGHVKILLENKARVDIAETNYERTPLHIGVTHDLPELMELLIMHGASVDARDSQGETPFMTALFQGNIKVVLAFIEKGAKSDSQDSKGRNLLHLAVYRGDHNILSEIIYTLGLKDDKILKKLLDAHDSEGHTPLTRALDKGYLGIAAALIEAGADVNKEIATFNGESPLSIARIKSMHLFSIIPLLLFKGAVGRFNVHNPAALKMLFGLNYFDMIVYLNNDDTLKHFIKDCFNPALLKRIAECIEILFLRHIQKTLVPGDKLTLNKIKELLNKNALLQDRDALKKFINENFKKIKDILFRQHAEKFKAAQEVINKITGVDVYKVEDLMENCMVGYIFNILLSERDGLQFWKPIEEGAKYEERKEIETQQMPYAVSAIIGDYIGNLENIALSPLEVSLDTEIQIRLLGHSEVGQTQGNLPNLERLLLEERRAFFLKHIFTDAISEHNPLLPLYRQTVAQNQTASKPKEQPKPVDPVKP